MELFRLAGAALFAAHLTGKDLTAVGRALWGGLPITLEESDSDFLDWVTDAFMFCESYAERVGDKEAVFSAYDNVSNYMYFCYESFPDRFERVRDVYTSGVFRACKETGIDAQRLSAFINMPVLIYDGIAAYRRYHERVGDFVSLHDVWEMKNGEEG